MGSPTKALPVTDTTWMDDGRCAGAPFGTMFPVDNAGVMEAQKVCERCPVTERCLEYALTNRIVHGVWGGTSERHRRRILKARRLRRE